MGLLVPALLCAHAPEIRAQQPGSAPEQPVSAAETATARALFEEGVTLSDEGRWAAAADRFERVLAIRWSSAAAFNLAAALVELGRLVDASELFRQVQRDETAAPEMVLEAERRIAALEPRLGKLHVLVAGDASGVDIYVDEHVLPPAAWGVPVIVDPGPHTVTAVRGGITLVSQSATLGGTQPLSAEVLVDIPAAAPSPAATAAAYEPAATPAPVEARPREEQLTDKWWFWTGAGVVAATTATVILIAVLASGGGEPTAPVGGTLTPGVLSGEVEAVR